MKKIICIITLVLIIFLVGLPSLAAESASSKYGQALKLAKNKDYDFAFLTFRSLLRNYPESKYAKEALFALGEYYYFTKSYGEADRTFNEYINKYDNTIGAVFAKVYLLAIVQYTDKDPARKKEAKDRLSAYFFSQPVILLFSEYKEISYLSAFGNKFIMRHYVDKIEVYRNGQIFAQLAP